MAPIACSHPSFGLNPCWVACVTVDVVLVILAVMILNRIFAMTDMRLMGLYPSGVVWSFPGFGMCTTSVSPHSGSNCSDSQVLLMVAINLSTLVPFRCLIVFSAKVVPIQGLLVVPSSYCVRTPSSLGVRAR